MAINLKPGQIIIIQGANLITTLQGNTRAKHVCMVAADPKYLWTTGAKFGLFFGKTLAEKYLDGKSFFICSPVKPLSQLQLDLMEETNREMDGQFYGFWKFGLLEAKAMAEGIPTSLNRKPKPGKRILNPICSQAVGAAYWAACLPIGEYKGKTDASALIPEDFEDEGYRMVLIRIVDFIRKFVIK